MMPSEPNERLTVEVRLLSDPCLWYWEIRDPVSHELVESSWTAGWVAYDSREEARLAGHRRLAELRSPLVTFAGRVMDDRAGVGGE